jgi:DNA-binding transcriptional MerR regulator
MTETRKKLYHSISEVSELLDVKPHVLRYWETQFRTLRPKKNRAGNRMYREKDLTLLERIKTLLYTKKYTIAGAKKALVLPEVEEETTSDGVDPPAAASPKVQAPSKPAPEADVLVEVRKEIETLKAWLEQSN